MKLIGVLVTVVTLVRAGPLAVEGDDAAHSLPEIRTDDSDSQVNNPSVRQFSVTIPELKQTHYQMFDDQGRYSFGYAFPDQMRTETRSEDGNVEGAYYYTDPNGNSNRVHYRADKSGFKVQANNLPVFHSQTIEDTPEVAEAKREHLRIWESIAKHNKADSDLLDTENVQETAQLVAASAEARTKPLAVDEPAAIEPANEESLGPASYDVVEMAPEARAEPSIRPLDPEVIVDDEKEAVITDHLSDASSSSPSLIEIDAEPIKLLAQLYAKHLEANGDVAEAIPRPEGFHPQNLQPAQGFDLFSRSEADDRDAVEVMNPEFVDLRAFLLTHRLRDGGVNSAADGDQPQIVIEAKEKDSVDHDLSTSDELDFVQLSAPYGFPKELYNRYYGLPLDRPVFLTREAFDNLPTSLKLATLSMVGADGQHTAQVAPAKQKSYPWKNIFSPYSSYYSPYYYYNRNSYYHPYGYSSYPYPYYNNYYSGYSYNPYYYY